MAIADYYARSALAAAQVLRGFQEELFRAKLERTRVAIAFSADATANAEGIACTNLLVRLLSRLYPTLVLMPGVGADSHAAELEALAREINPKIAIEGGGADVAVTVGLEAPDAAPLTIFTGSDGWSAFVSTHSPRRLGGSANPFGAGTAACIAAANVFRAVFLGAEAPLDEVAFSAFAGDSVESNQEPDIPDLLLDGPTALVGLGAVGNAAAWALARAPIHGDVYLVDHQTIELSNVQRYVLAQRADENRVKVQVAAAQFLDGPSPVQAQLRWAEFVQTHGYEWSRVLVALDSARDRRAVQASLPRWVANAWTQPGDLGVSVHGGFDKAGACLACLYIPSNTRPSDDQIVAQALGIPGRLMDVRKLLYTGEGVPLSLLEAVAEGLRVPPESVTPFEGRPIRSLYVEGICGGAILPLGEAGSPRADVHVPLAHQSALAGVLLASTLVRDLLEPSRETKVTRIDILRNLGRDLTQPALKAKGSVCFCLDEDYITAYRNKFGEKAGAGSTSRARKRLRKRSPLDARLQTRGSLA